LRFLPAAAITIGALAVWAAADMVQQQTAPPSTTFLVAHELGHIAAATACTLWLVPAWGFRSLIAAILAATLIDVDHAVAAGSIDPGRMMALGARPATHSLAGVALIGVIVLAAFGWRAGYAAFAGALTHIVLDANAPPGVPLLAPWSNDAHVLLPTWSLVPVILALGLIGVVLTRLGRRRPRPVSA
jgi:membrane-bound metal-dependent hydrolase YbcI (DUF457 family)